MKLVKRFATISAAATAVILLSAGGAQAQSDGGLMSLLGNLPLLRVANPMKSGGLSDSGTLAETQTNNNNNNNLTGSGPNNNNNNNGGGTNNNNNNNNGDTQAQGAGGIIPLLGGSLINFQVCYPKGQTGGANTTFTGNQNINCHQS
ncbi:hypothetical protein ACIQVT_24155 [Streptomyces sp. NPDC100445]|uniref:hypothetical protein n=1 Tax=Streptomyces sp. NPDC100445 TaxID=3366102 RepID=UPI00382167F4